MVCAGLTEGAMSHSVEALQNVGTQSHANHTLVVALQAQTQTLASSLTQALAAGQQKQTPGRFFLCGQLAHFKRDCPQEGNKTQEWKGLPLFPYPHGHKEYLWGSECHSKFDINGKTTANLKTRWGGGLLTPLTLKEGNRHVQLTGPIQ